MSTAEEGRSVLEKRHVGYARIASFILAVTLIVVVGYFTFTYFIVGFKPTAELLGLLVFSVIAGVAVFFSPCSFPLLPSYLAHYTTVSGQHNPNGRSKALYYGVIAALGVVTFNLILGGIIGAFGESVKSFALSGPQPNLYVRVFRGAIGSFLLALGLSALLGRGNFLAFLSGIGHSLSSTQTSSPSRGIYLYGFGYNAVGIGCGGPILAGLSAFALSFGGFSTAILAFSAFSVTMAVLMIMISLLAGTAKGSALTRMKNASPTIANVGRIVQIAVGGFFIFSAAYTDLFVRILFPSP